MCEEKIRNLEIIQGIINRMANNTFLLKGWSVTIIVGIFSLNFENLKNGICLLVYLVIVMFWGLDSYYLQLERQYRCIYYMCLNDEIEKYDLRIHKSDKVKKTCFYQCFFSKTEIYFYFSMILILTVVLFLL